MKFEDALNPTEAELREWAASANATFPDDCPQDWELIVADWSRIELIVELASDASCPNRTFFLKVLYLLAGECVRHRSRRDQVPLLRALLGRLKTTPSPSLQRFRDRAEKLLAQPSSFDYLKWCDGGYSSAESETDS